MPEHQEQLNGVYKEIILELYRHPLHKKRVVPCDAEGSDVNPSCGDEITITLQYAGGIIADIGHQGEGCAISQAAVSLLIDHVLGKSVEDIKKMDASIMNDLLPIDIPYTRITCAQLGWRVLEKLISKK